MSQYNATIDAGRGTTLPSSPYDGLTYHYASTAGAGTVTWTLRYDSGSGFWEVTGGPPLVANVATNESKTAASYGTLATAGPTITVPLAGDYFVQIGARPNQVGVIGVSSMSYTIGGTAAVDGDGAHWRSDQASSVENASVVSPVLLKSLAASSALTSQYKSAAATATFWQLRWMRVTPIRVTG